MGPGRRADQAEKRLLGRLLALFPDAHRVLDVGCGTGHFTRWLGALGFEATGLDNSPAMLKEARAGGGATYLEGDGHALPWPSREADLVLLITIVEFTEDPVRIVSEAIRVARHGVILGVLNRTSVLGWRRRRAGGAPWNAATFFSPAELRLIVHQAGGRRIDAITWRTALWPLPIIGSLPLPWGGFIGMAVRLNPGIEKDDGST
jgi:ubiquinone/menaquinone biosynthesis C-methylase UbiE